MPGLKSYSLYYRAAKILNPLFLVFVRFTARFSHSRIRVLVYNSKGDVLLVKSAFGMPEWELPGGAASSRETEKAAAIRELFEETAIVVTLASLHHIHSLNDPFRMEIYESHLKVHTDPQNTRPFEIRQVGWFSKKELPGDTAAYVRQLFQK